MKFRQRNVGETGHRSNWRSPAKWAAVWLLIAAPALAVSTSHWTQDSQDDFKAGTLHNVVATNLGEVKLSREVKTLLDEDARISMVTSLAQGQDGVIYAGTAPQGILMKVQDDKVSVLATIDDAVTISALVVEPNGGLLIGASGSAGRVLRIDKPGDKPHEIFSHKDVQYVWGLVELPDGMIYAATGPNGQLFAIHPDGTSEEIYKSDENNLTALTTDGKDLLYLGTDPNGLVIRVNRHSKESFVMYNAAEATVTALVLDAQGNLYASTGQIPSGPPQPPGENAQKEDTSGRPQSPAETPLPSQPPTPPKKPSPPGPNPGEPAPIPQKPASPRPAPAQSRQPSVMVFPSAGPMPGEPMMLALNMQTAPEDGPGDQPAPPVPGLPDQPGDGTPPDQGGADKGAAGKPGAEGEAAKPQGNAIYKIDRDGFVTEIFREQVVIYSMVQSGSVLLAGTGDDGEIYQVDPDAQETTVLAKTDAKQVTSLFAAADGRVILGLSNTGSIAAMGKGYAKTGTYSSAVLDATQVSRFGVMHLHGSLPKGTSMTIATRAGNVKDADAQGWSSWSPEADAQEYLRITSQSARFLQYRITFSTQAPETTPVIRDVDVAYQMPHMAPVVKSVKLTDAPPAGGAPPSPPPGGKAEDAPKPQGTGTQVITWDASSPDGDALVYSLYFRTASGPWILLKDNLSDTTYTWDTHAVADGRYEIKVSASDALANPVGDGKVTSRVSDPIVVDNTPPIIGDLQTKIAGTTVNINLRVTDETSTVASMEYSVDSSDVWQTVLPVDKIFDEPDETVAISVANLAPGAHQITLRATDAHGNIALQTVNVAVSEK
ncbi:MAG: hypothetical protein ABSH22_04485 [Tepidisphaeraceae bacterium]